ncbi:MAG: XRE family transcriptional regulator [Nitrospirae bacterium]|nr:MAG: XRE family transcriptional regulator [Nitrospirota bacterium]
MEQDVEIPKYIERIKQQYGITNDYALAKKLKVSQPEANWFRRGKKTPNPSVCIRMANLLGKNPIELLIVAQKDRATPDAKNHWAVALSAVDLVMNVPERPRYLPHKVEAIGQELRQLESQMLSYHGTIAHSEATHLMKTVERSIDSMMERWQVWKRDGSLFPNYLLANQDAVKRGVTIRRVFIFDHAQLASQADLADCLQVLNDQRRAGVTVFFAFREELADTLTFQRLIAAYRAQGVTQEINAAIFDDEVLIYSRGYREQPFGLNGSPTAVPMIDRLDITWNPDHLHTLTPTPLFETRYVHPFRGDRSFLTKFQRLIAKSKTRTRVS